MLASSWSPELLDAVGVALGEECRALGVGVLLGPGMNIKRSPLCGRNFEYFAEDPLVAGELASALVRGIQSQGIGTSVKHFAANNQETDRMRRDSQIDERTLREVYLRGFAKVVTERQAVDDHVLLQQGERHVRQREPLAAHRGAAGRVGLRRLRDQRLGRRA